MSGDLHGTELARSMNIVRSKWVHGCPDHIYIYRRARGFLDFGAFCMHGTMMNAESYTCFTASISFSSSCLYDASTDPFFSWVLHVLFHIYRTILSSKTTCAPSLHPSIKRYFLGLGFTFQAMLDINFQWVLCHTQKNKIAST